MFNYTIDSFLECLIEEKKKDIDSYYLIFSEKVKDK